VSVALLEVAHLTRRFGGLIAVNNVTLTVEAGEIRGLIGPNGAGKTTLFNLLTGVLRPTAGCVRFESADITGEATHRLVRRGLVRTYQLSQLFAGFTVFRNVLSALHVHARSGFWAGLLELPAVRRHNDALGIPRTTRLDHLVYACDELSGFLVAVALMRPTKKLADVEPANVRKRMKDKAFARAVPREMLLTGADELGLDFDEHVANMVGYLTRVAPEVGL